MKSFENDASDTLSAVPSVPIETRLNRLRKDGRDLNAVVQVLDARARRAADRPNATASGAGRTGALSNLTYGVKDLIAVGGVVTGMGIQQMGRKVAPDDAAVVKLVDEAGGILTATLAMTALAGVGRPEPPGCSVTGITRNPWDRRRWAGGSSGGPAAAVAADLTDFALGSESGGSIIVPAAWCGVTGLRPTLGAVPSRGVEILSPTMDKVGVIARTADLCLSVFECLVAGSHGSHPPQDVKTVGVVAVGDEWSTEVRRVFERAFAAVNETFDTRRLDHRPGNSLHLEAANSLMSVESAHTLRDLITDESVEFPDPGQREHLLTALAEPASVRDRALAVRDRAIMEWESLFEDVDAVVTLASRNVAPILESRRPPEGESGRILKSANLAGLPGVAFPCGFSRSGLPVGLHVIGPPGSDSALLKAVARFQAAHPFHQSLPPMPS